MDRRRGRRWPYHQGHVQLLDYLTAREIVEISGWDLAVALTKAITYATTLGASGGVIFLTLNPSLRYERSGLRAARAVIWLMMAAAVATLVKIFLAAGSMGDDFASMFDGENAAMILGAGEGRAATARLIGLLLCSSIASRSALAKLAPAGAILAATSFAWVGHAHAVHPNVLPLLSVSLHLLAAAFWLGALWPLMQATYAEDRAAAAAVVERFGRMAVKVVALLLAAGTVLLLLMLQRISDLWSSDYGRWLLLKLVLVTALLAAAAINKLKLTPRLKSGDAAAFIALRHSIAIEMALGAAILMVTALFTTVTGPGVG